MLRVHHERACQTTISASSYNSILCNVNRQFECGLAKCIAETLLICNEMVWKSSWAWSSWRLIPTVILERGGLQRSLAGLGPLQVFIDKRFGFTGENFSSASDERYTLRPVGAIHFSNGPMLGDSRHLRLEYFDNEAGTTEIAWNSAAKTVDRCEKAAAAPGKLESRLRKWKNGAPK
jgi:hypothetical protein